MTKKKRLLISIPSAPHGVYDSQLSWWLTAVQVQSALQDYGDTLAEQSDRLDERAMLRALAEKMGVAWSCEQAALQWLDASKIRDIAKPLVPQGWSVCAAPVYGAPIAANRNDQARRSLFRMDHSTGKIVPADFDAVLFIDTDNVPGSHDLHVLCGDIENEEVDVVGGVYCMEAPEGPTPLVYKLTPDGLGFEVDRKVLLMEPGLHELPLGGLPGGMLMIKPRVFARMWEDRRVWFKDRLHDNSFEYREIAELLKAHKDDKEGLHEALTDLANGKGLDWNLSVVGTWHIGEDIWFCRQLHEMGIPVWCDTRVFAKHIKKADNKQTFLRQQSLARRWWKRGRKLGNEHASDKELTEEYRAYCNGTVAEVEG